VALRLRTAIFALSAAHPLETHMHNVTGSIHDHRARTLYLSLSTTCLLHLLWRTGGYISERVLQLLKDGQWHLQGNPFAMEEINWDQ
jgi:hypothetical protein